MKEKIPISEYEEKGELAHWGYTQDELRGIASRVKIPGRSSMSKSQLVVALNERLLDLTVQAVSRSAAADGATVADVSTNYRDIAGYTPRNRLLGSHLGCLVARGQLSVEPAVVAEDELTFLFTRVEDEDYRYFVGRRSES